MKEKQLMNCCIRFVNMPTFRHGLHFRNMSSTLPKQIPKYETLSVTVPKPFVYHVELNRPDKLNSMNHKMWNEIGQCFNQLDGDEDCRAILLSASGRVFTAGLDFEGMAMIGSKLAEYDDVARRCKILKQMIVLYQNSISSLEKCAKPVVCCIHGACIGGGVDLITAADMRYSTEDATFQVKEVDIGMAADVGTLQRLPRCIGSMSLVNELCFTARKMEAPEALSCGLISRMYPDKQKMIDEALKICEQIAEKSPVAVQGTKQSIIYSRDHTVQEGLDNIAQWNQTALQSEDFINASVAQATKSPPPPFAKL